MGTGTRLKIAAIATAAVTAILGAAATYASRSPNCPPGAERQCHCNNGDGYQTCQDDGTRYGPCDCGEHVAEEPEDDGGWRDHVVPPADPEPSVRAQRRAASAPVEHSVPGSGVTISPAPDDQSAGASDVASTAAVPRGGGTDSIDTLSAAARGFDAPR